MKTTNPILIAFILVVAFFVWLLLVFLFRPIGKLFTKLFGNVGKAVFDDVKDEVSNEESKEKKTIKEEERNDVKNGKQGD